MSGPMEYDCAEIVRRLRALANRPGILGKDPVELEIARYAAIILDECRLISPPPRFVIFDPLILPRAYYSQSVARDVGAAHAWSDNLALATAFPTKAEALAYAEVQLRNVNLAVMERWS